MKKLLLFLIALNLSNFANSHEVRVYANMNTNLKFDTSIQGCALHEITFNGKQIYENDRIINGSLQQNQVERFQLKVTHKGKLRLQLYIKNVQDIDGGLYQLRVHGTSSIMGTVLEEIGLIVLEPFLYFNCRVHKITCTCDSLHEDIPLEIICYQGAQRLHPSSLRSNQYFFTAEYSFDPADVINCCRVRPYIHVPSENCHDFVRYPTTGQLITPDNTESERTMFVDPPNSGDAREHAPGITKFFNPDDAGNHDLRLVRFVSFLFITSMIVLPLGLLYCFRVYRHKSSKCDNREDFMKVFVNKVDGEDNVKYTILQVNYKESKHPNQVSNI